MVSYGNASGPPDPFPPGLLAQKGSLFLTRPTLFNYIATREELEQSAADLFDIVRSGKVQDRDRPALPLERRGRSAPAARSAQDDGIDGSDRLRRPPSIFSQPLVRLRDFSPEG